MQIRCLNRNDFAEVMDLFCECFRDDHYYSRKFPDPATREARMREKFASNIEYTLTAGLSYGVWDEAPLGAADPDSEQPRVGSGACSESHLIAFVLCFDYFTLKEHDEAFYHMFGGHADNENSLPYHHELHDAITPDMGPVLFMLSIGVKETLRGKGLASALVDYLLDRYKDHTFVSDVSNRGSLPIYERRGCEIREIDTEYYLVTRPANTPQQFDFYSEKIHLALPDISVLTDYDIPFEETGRVHTLTDVEAEEYFGKYFLEEVEDHFLTVPVVALSYKALLQYQRVINLSQNRECVAGDVIYYVLKSPYENHLLINDVLDEMLPVRNREWNVVPDVFVSVPMQYSDLQLIRSAGRDNDEDACELLRYLEFRTQYEAGIPSSLQDVDELANLKNRLERYYLGKVKIQILNEVTVDNYKSLPEAIGEPALLDLYITVDNKSKCAVLTWYTLSAPYLISHYMDNIIRNQIQAQLGGQWVNLYEYLSVRFRLIKRGTPKMFVTVPEDRHCLGEGQLASILASETIYPEGENFGNIIDTEIVQAVTSPTGLGQYDRGFVAAYTNVLIQFSPDLKGCVRDRLNEESITVFYMELVIFEEAAIHIADQAIIKLFTSKDFDEPVAFLKQVDNLYDAYSKTIDFWDLQVNYPTSQKSMQMIRRAFKVKDQLENMHRNRDQLQVVFDTKCDMIDRSDSRRMDTSLAILSILAVFSAWIDGHDYISAWSNVFSATTIDVLHILLFVGVLITAIYAVTRLFGGRLLFHVRKKMFKRLQRKLSRHMDINA